MVSGEIFVRDQQAWGCSTQKNELGAEGVPSRGRMVSPLSRHNTTERGQSQKGEAMRQAQGQCWKTSEQIRIVRSQGWTSMHLQHSLGRDSKLRAELKWSSWTSGQWVHGWKSWGQLVRTIKALGALTTG